MALKNNVTNTVGQIPGSPSLDVPYDTAAVVLSGIMAASQQLVVHRVIVTIVSSPLFTS